MSHQSKLTNGSKRPSGRNIHRVELSNQAKMSITTKCPSIHNVHLGQNVHPDEMSIESQCPILDILTRRTFCLHGHFDLESLKTTRQFWSEMEIDRHPAPGQRTALIPFSPLLGLFPPPSRLVVLPLRVGFVMTLLAAEKGCRPLTYMTAACIVDCRKKLKIWT